MKECYEILRKSFFRINSESEHTTGPNPQQTAEEVCFVDVFRYCQY